MYRSITFVTLALAAMMIVADRPDIASTIPDSFWFEIDHRQQAQIDSKQKIYLSKSLNKAKSVQTIIKDGQTTTFITIADFSKKKASVFSSDHKICYIDDIFMDFHFVDDVRNMFADPAKSPMQEKDGLNMFTVNWKSIEGVDDWTHFYFEKGSNVFKKFEHYFKEEHEDPWVVFDVITPITKQDFQPSDFENPDCPITA